MGSISSSVGLISGIDSGAIIEQLLSISARPRLLAQQRVIQLQAQQSAFLDLNSRLSSLRSASQSLRTTDIFQAVAPTSSDESILTATAEPGASQGDFSFIVDRLVSTQQLLSRGFVDRDSSPVGASEFIFEGTEGRLDRDAELATLNNFSGITRGRIQITDREGRSATIDLSTVGTVNDVLDAINNASGIEVSATVEDNAFVLTDASGGAGQLQIDNIPGEADVISSLGFNDTPVTADRIAGSSVYGLSDATPIQLLNDGNGIRINDGFAALNGSGLVDSGEDFTITTRDDTDYKIRLGELFNEASESIEGPVSTIGALRNRIESLTEGKATIEVNTDGTGINIVDTTGASDSDLIITDADGTAADLGFVSADGATSQTASDTITGDATFAELNSTLLSNLLGGRGLTEQTLLITDEFAVTQPITIPTNGSVSDLIDQLKLAGLDASLDDSGTGLIISADSTLTLGGDAATELGIAGTVGPDQTIRSGRLQHAYVSLATKLEDLRDGTGIGTGSFRIQDGNGAIGTIVIDENDTTIEDILDAINGSSGVNVLASINDSGDGIVVTDTSGGTSEISISDIDGTVAANLNLAGTASGTGGNNFLDGSYETTVSFEAGDTLDEVINAVNNSTAGVNAEIINDGAGAAPYRIVFASDTTGARGAFTLDTGGFDLGLTTLSEGLDSRVFFGSDDAATGVLIASSTNTIDDVVTGVSIDLKAASDEAVTLSVARDNAAIEEKIGAFISAFNDTIARIDTLTDFDQETETAQVLFADSTARQLRQALFNAIQQPADNISGAFQVLSQVGVRVGDGGVLELNTTRFREALESDPQAVESVFSARVQVPVEPIEISPGITANNPETEAFTSLGVAELVAEFIDRYVNSIDGVLTRKDEQISRQIDLQNGRIENINVRLSRQEETLIRQFANMEQTIAQLQSQGNALAGLSF